MNQVRMTTTIKDEHQVIGMFKEAVEKLPLDQKKIAGLITEIQVETFWDNSSLDDGVVILHGLFKINETDNKYFTLPISEYKFVHEPEIRGAIMEYIITGLSKLRKTAEAAPNKE